MGNSREGDGFSVCWDRDRGTPRWADDPLLAVEVAVAVAEAGEIQLQGRWVIGQQEERAWRGQ